MSRNTFKESFIEDADEYTIWYHIEKRTEKRKFKYSDPSANKQILGKHLKDRI